MSVPQSPPEGVATVDASTIVVDGVYALQLPGGLGDLPSAARAMLQQSFRVRHVAAGDRLFNRGDAGDTMYVVGNGLLRAEFEHEGERTTVGSIGPGEVVGEMAVLDPEPRAVDVVAVTDCHLFGLRRSDLEHLTAQHPAAAVAVINLVLGDVHRRLRRLNRTLHVTLGQRDIDGPEPEIEAIAVDEPGGADLLTRLWRRLRS